MKKPLLEELLAAGNIEAIKVADSGNLIYFENQQDQNRHVEILTYGTVRQPDVKPENQNPTLKFSIFSELTTAEACLLKGSLLSAGKFQLLDNVAHESAEALIINAQERMSFTDYTARIDSITGINFTINHGVGGNKYAIVGFVPTNFNLNDLANLPNQQSTILQVGEIKWSAAQIRSTLVYTATGVAVIPVFVKLGLANSVTAFQSFNVTDVSGGFGNVTGQLTQLIDFDWDGLEADATYTNNQITSKFAAAYKALTTSQIKPVVMTAGLYAAFVQKGLINDSLVNSSFKDAAVVGNAPTWELSGTIPTPSESRPLVTYAFELPKAVYDQLAILQWTKPQLAVFKLGDQTFTVENLMAQLLTYQSKYYIPYNVSYNVDTGVDRVVNLQYGWAGLVINNEWTIETGTIALHITVVADPFKYATAATAFMVTDPTAPITVVINGVEQTFINYYAFLDSNILATGREAGLVLMSKG